MSECADTRDVAHAHADLDRLVDELNPLDLTSCTSDEIVEALRAHEALARRLTYTGYRLINEARDRRLPDDYGCPSMGRFLRPLLRLDPREAAVRARAAAAAGPARTLTGEPLPAPFAQVAAAQAVGAISERHASIIEKTIEALPETAQAEKDTEIEAELVGYAAAFDPVQLATLARRIAAHCNPDGSEPDEQREQARREISFHPRADGWTRMDGWLSPELTERWQTILDTFAAPAAAVDGVRDTRSTAQRNHDGTLTAFETLMRVGDVPSNNGVSCTVIVTMTRQEYETGEGLARTGHGHLVPARDAIRWGAGDTSVLTVALDSMRAISHYGHAHRIFSQNQRRAITARDRGCTFPACPEPPARCQVDHVIRHEHGGPTSVANGHLLCRYNHREHERQGWHAVMMSGIPHWIPPTIVDPARKPVRNTLHDIELHPGRARPE